MKQGDWIEVLEKRENGRTFFYHGTLINLTKQFLTINDIKLGETKFPISSIARVNRIPSWQKKLLLAKEQTIQSLITLDEKLTTDIDRKIAEDMRKDFVKLGLMKPKPEAKPAKQS